MLHQVQFRWAPDMYIDDTLLSRHPNILVYSLPMEVLAHIFYYFVLTTRTPVGSLMLVCTKWHQAIQNSPLLWSIIDIDVPKSISGLDGCAKYCENAVIRSGNRLLDITFSFSKSKNSPPHDGDEVQNKGPLRLGDEIHPCHSISKNKTPNKSNPEQSLREAILHTLIGPKGEVMKRWKSFHYTSTLDVALDPMISLLNQCYFRFPTPFLESFILDPSCFPWQISGDSVRHAYSDRMIRRAPPLPCMPRVKTLKIPGIELSVHKKDIDPAILQEFACIFKNADAFRFILSSQSLSHLHIGFRPSRWSNSIEGPITFPRLEFLHVSAGFPPKFWSLLNTPKVETLVLDSLSAGRPYESARISRTFPQLKRLDVRHLSIKRPNKYLVIDFVVNSPNLALLTYCQHSTGFMFYILDSFTRPSCPLFSKLDQISVGEVVYDERSGKRLCEEQPVNIRTFREKR
jgi:hypothetical protein